MIYSLIKYETSSNSEVGQVDLGIIEKRARTKNLNSIILSLNIYLSDTLTFDESSGL